MSDNRHFDEPTGFEVAVIGAAGRFPGARNLDEYWRIFAEGRETIRRFARDELIRAGADPDAVDSPSYVPVSPMIGDVDLFDASFFNFSPREAEVIDPQGRFLLELAWQALETAGYSPSAFEGLIGAFMGGRLSTYMLQVFSNPEVVARTGDMNVQIGSDKDYLASRIAYKLDLGGPAVTVQTACSSALVGVHMACQALVAGECDLALAGGSSLRVPEIQGYHWVSGGVTSRNGRIRAFDADADGTVFGNGVGLVALRRLDDALADRDRILGVIKGSAVTNDGSQRVGFTAPGIDGQRRVIRAAQLAAEVEADTISYIEAHGTGTPIGDPIEIEALTGAFRETTARKGYCAVTSAKSNIGHLSAAAGIAGLIKVLLAMEHRQIPPSVNFERPNPQIDFDGSPFFVNRELRDWTVDGMPRRAGVSAFGIGGTNAHVIVEEPPARAPSEPSHREHQIIVLSARTGSALDAATEQMADCLESAGQSQDLADVAYTLQRGRKAFEQRRLAVCRSTDDAVQVLRGEEPTRLLSGTFQDEETPVVFMFSGQGSQYAGMGAGLYRQEPSFRSEVDRCAEILIPEIGRDLRELLFPEAGATEETVEADEALGRTELTQPALFTIEYALAKLWMSWGVTPAAMIGHSIGEYVAAVLASVLELEDALRLVAARGRLMQAQPAGDMLSVSLPEPELVERLGPELSLAAVNAPSRCVVSGPAASVAALAKKLEADGVGCRPLHTSHAFHSAMMESMLPAFLDAFEGVDLHAPEIPFVSNVTGDWITEEQATDPGYWAHHLRHAVRFAAGLETLAGRGPGVFLEVGPGKSLATLARQNRALPKGSLTLASMRHPKDQAEDGAVVLETLGRLWIAGVPIDWQGFHEGAERNRVKLPTYPFEHRSYWVEASSGGLAGMGQRTRRKTDPADWYALPAWRPSVIPAPLPATAGNGDEPGAEPVWVLFDDGTSPGLTGEIDRRLAGDGRSVVRVAPGDAFASLGEVRFAIGGGKEDYEGLLRALKKEGFEDDAPLHVIHLWNAGEAGAASVDEAEERGFWSLLWLAQAVGATGGDRPVRLATVTSGMQQVAGEPVPHPERAMVLGPSQVMSVEYPGIRAAAVDVDAGSPSVSWAELADALIAEVEGGLPDPVVAYRGGDRWVRGFEQVRLAEATPERLRLRDGGVYLITGGLGGFGRTFAEHLAREHRARLVLLGRTPLPERDRWDRILETAPEGDGTASKIRTVRAIEELGGEVLVEAADVTDADSLGAVVAQARERFGALHGVIHAAGVPGGGMMQLKDRETARAVLAPKVRGTLALEQALGGSAGGNGLAWQELDFLVLCSSTIAVLGGFGQVDYCAGNSFLDAFARSRRSAGGPYVVSLNWTAWKDVGMAVETTLPAGAAGLAGTRAAAGGGADVSPFEGEPLHPLLDQLVERTDERVVFSTVVGADRQWVLDEHRIQGTPTLPGTAYLEMVRAAVEMVAGPGAIDVHDLFFLQPVMVPEGKHREVRLTLESRRAADWSFVVTSSAGDGHWTEHARGGVARVDATAPAAVSLDDLRARCSKEVLELTGDELANAEKLVYWGPRWHSLRRVHVGENEGVIHLELPEEFSGDVDEVGLHPALVDVATAIGGGMVAEGSFLPLSYHRVRVFGRLPASFDAHIEVSGGRGKETVSLDVTLFTEEGGPLVAVEGFTMKRVGEAARSLESAGPASGSPAVAAADEDERPRTLFGGSGMSPDEGVEALRRVLTHGRHPQMVVAQRDIEAMIEQVRSVLRTELGGGGDGQAASGGGHPRPDLATAFVAPRNDVEETLAGIWAVLLGLEKVGVHDNFFELGGDSILGIRVINQASEAGLELSPEMLFEHQTVAELAELLGETGAAETGPVPLTPYQRRLAALGPEPSQVVVAEVEVGSEAPAPGAVIEALEALVAAHPALGLRYGAEEAEAPDDAEPVRPPVAEADPAGLMEAASKVAAELDPAAGRSVGAVLASAGDEVRLLLVLHRMAGDLRSAGLLALQLARVLEEIGDGKAAEVAAGPASFGAWARSLAGSVAERRAEDETSRWSGLAGDDALDPFTATKPAEPGEGLGVESVTLEAALVSDLEDEVRRTFNTRLEEELVTAVGRALDRVRGGAEVPLTLRIERDARRSDPDGNLDDGVGSFTVAFPLTLDGPAHADPGAVLTAVKESLRAVPGLGYGFDRLLVEGPEGLGAVAEPTVAFTLTAGPVGRPMAPERALTVVAVAGDGALALELLYDRSRLDGATVAALGGEIEAELRALVETAKGLGDAVFSPSDFPEADLDEDDLARVLSKLD